MGYINTAIQPFGRATLYPFVGKYPIVRIAKGNLRILTRLFQQLERLIKINNITSINTDLVNAAREALVSGS